MHTGPGGRVDSQAPLIHAGALRRSEPVLELLLVDFAARKALLENVAARMWPRPVAEYHTRLLRELSAQPATCLAIPMSAMNCPAVRRTQSPDAWLRHPVQGRTVGGSGLPEEDLRKLHRSMREPGE